MEQLKELHQSLDRRYRPEDVAELIHEIYQENNISLSSRDREILNVNKHNSAKSLRERGYRWYNSSMSSDFWHPYGMINQISLAQNLSHCVDDFDRNQYNYDLRNIGRFLEEFERKIGINFTKKEVNIKTDRLNKNQRKAARIDIPKRHYNRLFRMARRLERNRNKLAKNLEKRQLQQISKSRFAYATSFEDFSKDLNSALFVAYFTAKCNKRSIFTNTSQERPFDDLCDVLFKRCEDSETTNWNLIAQVYPDPKVLAHLNDQEKGELIGKWFTVMQRTADLLESVWQRSRFNFETMIVKKGDDSTTWNVMAGAWNKARSAWISLLYATNTEDILRYICLGKVLRLMAADVAYWHKRGGGDLEPDTQVWVEVPLPWDVLHDKKSCTKDDIEVICAKHGVDPHKKGWTEPMRSDVVHKFNPTPELVHGVAVGSPFLASYLKKRGVFSGKTIKNTEGENMGDLMNLREVGLYNHHGYLASVSE